MIFGDSMGRMALASRWQNAACFAESSEKETTRSCCKGTNIFAKCHPVYRKSGLILFIFKLNSFVMKKNEYLLRMQNEEPSLFSPKERYWMTHTANGKNRCFAQLPESEQRKMRYENMHLMAGMQFTIENKMPIVASYNGNLDFRVVSYANRTKHDGAGEAMHFFLDDYKFSSVWKNLERVTHSLYKYDYLFAPDYSLFIDDDRYQQVNKQDIYRSRFIAAYWQQCGYQVIPTASWGDANSLKYCFEGLPENSVIAVCGVGHDQDNAHKVLWNIAVCRLIEEKKPTTLVVYGGKEEDYLQLSVKVKYIPDFINQHFRTDGKKTQVSI